LWNHFRLKYDKHYTLGDFGSRLHQRPDLTDKLAVAFDDLLSIINQVPDPREGTESILESGFFSCLPSCVNLDMEKAAEEHNGSSQGILSCLRSRVNSDMGGLDEEDNNDRDSDQSFEDAL
jgi:hypothetical protein